MDESFLLPCPECGAEVYEDADRCPKCGNYIIPGRRRRGTAGWIRWTALGLVALIVAVWVLQC